MSLTDTRWECRIVSANRAPNPLIRTLPSGCIQCGMAGSGEIGKPPIRVGKVGHEPLFEHGPFAGWGPKANAGYQSEPDASKATRQFIMLLDVCRAVGVVGGRHQFLFFGKVSPGLSGHIGARHGDAVTVVGVQCTQQAIEFLQHRLVFAVELFALRGQLLKPRHSEDLVVLDGKLLATVWNAGLEHGVTPPWWVLLLSTGYHPGSNERCRKPCVFSFQIDGPANRRFVAERCLQA